MGFPEGRGRLDPHKLGFDENLSRGWVAARGPKDVAAKKVQSFDNLHRSVSFFRVLGFLLWFVLGPGGPREAPGGPGKAHA